MLKYRYGHTVTVHVSAKNYFLYAVVDLRRRPEGPGPSMAI